MIDFTIAPPLGANAAVCPLNAPAPWGANVRGILKSPARGSGYLQNAVLVLDGGDVFLYFCVPTVSAQEITANRKR
jgi:hypothetical protein